MRLFFINLLILVLSFMGSSSLVTANSHSLVVDTDWLNTRLDDSELMIVDVRSFEKYQQAHIKNAINLPVDDTFGVGVNNNSLASIPILTSLFSKAGIEHDAYIILYDDGRLIDAARLFWVFEVLGHARVSVLNGGLNAWKNKAYALSQEVKKPRVSTFIPAINPAALATTISVHLNSMNKNHVLIDVRPKEEYEGLASRTDQYGHIPGAINIPSKKLQDAETGKLLPQNQLAELYQWVDKDKPVTVYCNKGKESALSYFALRQLGYSVNAYNGSWVEWSKNPQLPIVMESTTKTVNAEE